MPNIGPMELAVVAIIALVVFGPKRLPELGSSLGRGMREFKSSISAEHEEEADDAPRLEASTAQREPEASTPEAQTT
jgi:sec-independent protein translocase protein TatA